MNTILTSPRRSDPGFLWWTGPLIAAALMTLPSVAHAAPQVCVDHGNLSKFLSDKHAEAPVGVGLASNGGLVQVYSSPKGDTWTIFMTLPDGTACLMAAGESWEKLDLTAAGPKT